MFSILSTKTDKFWFFRYEMNLAQTVAAATIKTSKNIFKSGKKIKFQRAYLTIHSFHIVAKIKLWLAEGTKKKSNTIWKAKMALSTNALSLCFSLLTTKTKVDFMATKKLKNCRQLKSKLYQNVCSYRLVKWLSWLWLNMFECGGSSFFCFIFMSLPFCLNLMQLSCFMELVLFDVIIMA